MSAPIIDRPDLLSPSLRIGGAALTAAFWILYIYLWMPILSLIIWGFQIGIFYREMIVLDGLTGFVELLISYGLVIVIMGIVYLGWALMNYYRFRNVERRQNSSPTALRELALYFSVPENDLNNWQRSKVMSVSHDINGNVLALHVHSAQPQPNHTSSRNSLY